MPISKKRTTPKRRVKPKIARRGTTTLASKASSIKRRRVATKAKTMAKARNRW
jgi:hypothetical protein